MTRTAISGSLRTLSWVLALLSVCSWPPACAQQPSVFLTLQVDDASPVVLDLAMLKTHASESLDVHWERRGGVIEKSTFVGIPVRKLLSLLNVPTGAEMRGRWLRYVVAATGADGYSVSFGLGELEPALTGRRAVVAWQRDGATLPAGESPLRLVIEGDTRPSRSVRELVGMRVFDPLARNAQSGVIDRLPPSPKTP